MYLTSLTIRRLRRFESVQLSPVRGRNLLVGDNGAGKTSVLEALHLLAYGRSFRGRPGDGLIQAGAADLEVVAEWQEPSLAGERRRRAGLRHGGREWTARLDGEDVAALGDLCAAVAVVTFEPGSHQLVMGAAEHRRRFLDWGLFHVEQSFTPTWRRYNRALKQRNALLKQHAPVNQLLGWDQELVAAGERVTDARVAYLAELEPEIAQVASELAPSLQFHGFSYLPGWRADLMPLADALLNARERDRLAGFTSVGPHRADWSAELVGFAGREHLSRGQAKLLALACLLGQAQHLARRLGHWPIIALDDLASELDADHQAKVLAWLERSGAQTFITGTAVPATMAETSDADTRMFHVEHGQIRTPDSAD